MSTTVLQECNATPVDCLLKPGAHITHNVTYPLSVMAGGTLNYMQLPLKPQKVFFFTYVLVLHKTCKYTLMYKKNLWHYPLIGERREEK